MNNEYLERAKEKIPDAKTLIVLASKRARDLALGAPPMVRCQDENFLDVALLEIAEGLLEANFDNKPEEKSIIDELANLKAAAQSAESSGKKKPEA